MSVLRSGYLGHSGDIMIKAPLRSRHVNVCPTFARHIFVQFHERCCATSNCNRVYIRVEFIMYGVLLVAIEAGNVGRHRCKTILHRHNIDIVPSVLSQLRWMPSGAFVGSALLCRLRYEAAWAFVVVLWLYFPLCKINWTRLRNTPYGERGKTGIVRAA